MRWWTEECFEELDVADPLRDERIEPLEDDEAARLEELCQAAVPGRVVIDDRSDGTGFVLATLPDGRHIVHQGPALGDAEEIQAASEATIELMCRARCMVRRMLHDRRARIEQEERLREKLRDLETELGRRAAAEHAEWSGAEWYRSRPR